jgi:Spy/CpxP family protein refolding chaperone
MKISVIVSVVLLSLMIPCITNAQNHQGKSNRQSRENIWSGINLNEHQKQQIDSLRNDLRTTEKQNFNQIKSVRKEIADELLKSSPDSNVLQSYARQLGEIHTKMADDWITHLQSVKGVLSSEQFSKLIENGLKKTGNQQQYGTIE